MSRSRSQRRSNSASGSFQADAEIIDGLSFRPSVACGGKISASEYNLRSRKCTEEQLSRLQESAEYKTWSKTRSGQRPWTAHLETAKAFVRSSPRAVAGVFVVLALITAALVAPGAIPTTSTGVLQRPATTIVAKEQTPPPRNVIERAPPSATPSAPESTEPSVSTKELEAMAAQLKAEQARANALAVELATARAEQQKAAAKLAASTAREASLSEEIHHLSTAAKDAAKQLHAKTQTTTTPTKSTSLLAIPGMALLCIEAVLVCLAALTVLSLRRSRTAAETAKRQYLVAYRRQQAVLAMAEDTFTAAQQEAATVHKTLEAGAQQAAQVRDKAATAAAERAAAWSAAGTQLLQLAQSPSKSTPTMTTPSKKGKKGGSSADKSGGGADMDAVPSPTKVADAVAARCAELKSRAAAAETAAAAAAAQAEESQRERVWNEQKAAETLTDNELLKEQLADSKKALGDAAARIAQVESALEETRQGLAAVEAERSVLLKERDALQASLQTEAGNAARLARESSGLEAQVEQLTASLAAEASAKAHAESRFQQVDSELNSLKIFAESLEMQKEALEAELADAKATIALTANNQTNAAAFDASRASQLTGAQDGDLVPAPVLPSRSRSHGNNNTDGSLSGNNSAPHSARRTSSLSVRVGQIVDMLADGMDGALASASEGVVPHSPGALWIGASAPSSGRRTSRDSTGSTLSARLARASELFNVAERLLGQKLPGEAGGDEDDDMRGVRPYADVPLLSAGVYTSGHDGAEAAVARVAAAVDQSRSEIARTLGALRASSKSNPAALQSADLLESAQHKVDEALHAAYETAAAASALRSDHASLAEIARRRQAELESAQNALAAAMEGDGSPGGATSAVVASAAKHLTDAEAAQRIAAEAVYEAERAWHRAVSDDLAARNALVTAQSELARAQEAATGLVTPGAWSVSPRVSLAPASPGVALRG